MVMRLLLKLIVSVLGDLEESSGIPPDFFRCERRALRCRIYCSDSDCRRWVEADWRRGGQHQLRLESCPLFERPSRVCRTVDLVPQCRRRRPQQHVMNITDVQRVALAVVADLRNHRAVVEEMRAVSVAKVDEQRRQLLRIERIQQVRVVVKPAGGLVEALARICGSGGAEGERVALVTGIQVDDERVQSLASHELVE